MAVSLWVVLNLGGTFAQAKSLTCEVLVEQATSAKSEPASSDRANAENPRVVFLKNESSSSREPAPVAQLAAAALQVALRESQAGQTNLAKTLFRLDEKLFAQIPKNLAARKAEILTATKDGWDSSASTYGSALKEFRLGYVSKKSESFSYLRSKVVEGILFPLVQRAVDANRIETADLFSRDRMMQFFKSHAERQGVRETELVWEKLSDKLDPEWQDSFQLTPESAAALVVRTASRLHSEEHLKELAENRLRELIKVLESSPKAVDPRSLQLAKERLAKLSAMGLFEFMDTYLVNPRVYFELFFLPAHGSYEQILSRAKWETRVAPLKSVNLPELRALLEKLRPQPTYVPKNVNWTNGNALLVATEALGESMATVRRAVVGKERTPVVYKAYTAERNFAVVTYEFYFSEYANRARSFRMPRVLFHNVATGELVKEYVHGLSFDELAEHYGENSPALAELLGALQTEKAIVQHVTAGFNQWLQQKDRQTYQKLNDAYPGLVGGGDSSKTDNWLFDPQRGQWILHDP